MQQRVMKTCKVPLAPKVVKSEGDQPLRIFRAPTTSNESNAGVKTTFNVNAHSPSKPKTVMTRPNRNAILKPSYQAGAIKDIEGFIAEMDVAQLTNEQAEEIVYPFNVNLSTSVDAVLDLFEQRFRETAATIKWNVPSERAKAFITDLRFSSDWWLCMSDPTSAAAVQARTVMRSSAPEMSYPPLLSPEERNEASENQLLADIIERLSGRLYHLEMLHVDRMDLTPQRMQALAFCGFASVERSQAAYAATFADGKQAKDEGELRETILELKVLSFSICNIGTASLLVLLSAISGVLEHGPFIDTLDLSYNALTSKSLYTISLKMPQTRITRLSLRGNNLNGKDSTEFRDFMLEGCSLAEELDLSYTHLSTNQVHVLIDSIPDLYGLRVLLIDGIDIPPEKSSVFAKAIADSRIWMLSLNCSTLSNDFAYMEGLRMACEKNANKTANRGERRRSSFFRKFYELAAARGAGAPGGNALPIGYHPFRTNDPSCDS